MERSHLDAYGDALEDSTEAERVEHEAHRWTPHPETGELVDESHVTVGPKRLFWCGFVEPATD